MAGQQNTAFEMDESENGQQQTNGSYGWNKDAVTNSSSSFGIFDVSKSFYKKHRRLVKIALICVANILALIYFIFAALHFSQQRDKCLVNCGLIESLDFCNGFGGLILFFVFVYWSIIYYFILKPTIGKRLYASLKPLLDNQRFKRVIRLVLIFVFAGVTILVLFFQIDEWQKLQSLVGVVAIITFGYIISFSAKNIKWQTVSAGIVAQFILGILLIKWPTGRNAFRCFGDKVVIFLGYATPGASFVYGDLLVNKEAVFAFTVLPVIFFFSLMVSVTYYLGLMQWVVKTLGWVLQKVLGTTVCESVNAAADVFLGQSESILTIRPYLKDLTKSEYHALMTAGFATVSGSVLAAYINFGIEPANLVTASCMAAPASLCIAKLIYPETEESKTSSDNIKMAKSTESSLLDAATKGCSDAIGLVLGITANLIGFIAFMAFINGMLGYFAIMLGYGTEENPTKITLEFFFGYIFTPLAWALGIPWEESSKVGELIGLKTVVNEFVAFERLGSLRKMNAISPRSAAIATFALCGFANPSSMGIMIGAMSSLEPSRRKDITSVAFRAFIAGSCVTFMTASIAGLLIEPDMFGDPGTYGLVLNETTH